MAIIIKTNNINFDINLHNSYKTEFLIRVLKDSKNKLKNFSENLKKKKLTKNWEKFQKIENLKKNLEIFKKNLFLENKISYKNLDGNLIEIFNLYEKKGNYYILCIYKKKLILLNKNFEKIHEIFLDFEISKSVIKIEENSNFLYFLTIDKKIKKYIIKINFKKKIFDFKKKEEKDFNNEIDDNYDIFLHREILILKKKKKNLILDLKLKKIIFFENKKNYEIYKYNNIIFYFNIKR